MKSKLSSTDKNASRVNDHSRKAMPEGPLISWFGDDFTGAAAVMEVLTFAGLPSMLFLQPPTEQQLAKFQHLRGIGIASTARAQTPAWMDEHLPGMYQKLSQFGAPLIHYKVCTTLDSSPDVGSIGRALELGAKVFKPSHIPVLIAAPQMRRYQAFGHLFAAASDKVYRLDRHPVMAQHPVTPMHESDVAVHLAKQMTATEIESLTLEDLQYLANQDFPARSVSQQTTENPSAVVIDSMEACSETTAGKYIWEQRESANFVVGSQGVEYALIRYWQSIGALKPVSMNTGIGHAGRLAVISGSVSPITAEQIEWSENHGFECLFFEPTATFESDLAEEKQIDHIVKRALQALEQGLDPLIYTARGPNDSAVNQFNHFAASSGRSKAELNRLLGITLGKVLSRLVIEADLKRAIISGGDTSGYATQQLGVFALTALAPTIPGAAIFQVHSEGPMNGLQLALKGGQMGSRDYFGWVREGGGAR